MNDITRYQGGGAVGPAELAGFPAPPPAIFNNQPQRTPTTWTPRAVSSSAPLPAGVTVSSDDLPVLKYFAGALREDGVPESAIASAIRWYERWRQEVEAVEQSRDEGDTREAAALLTREMGAEGLRRAKTQVREWLNEIPEPLALALETERDADGRLLINDPATFKWLHHMATLTAAPPVRNTGSSGAPASTSYRGGNSAGDAEIARIEEVMRTNQRRYFQDAEMQQRYRELLEARDG